MSASILAGGPDRISRSDVTVMARPTVDDPQALGLEVGVHPGGDYLRGRLVGEPPAVYEQIGPGRSELERLADRDPGRPLVEFYRRRDQVEL
jgi:hypothetical protein